MTGSRSAKSSADPVPQASGSLSDHIGQNVSSIAGVYERERETLSPARRRVERLSAFVARPGYLLAILGLVALWVAANVLARHAGIAAWDPPPFGWLQGLLTLVALLTSTVVLIAQLREAKLEQQRQHLELQVNLLTEQKVTQLIRLVEELRRDLPMVKDRHDPLAESLQQPADTAQLLGALAEVGLTRTGDES